ncbi:unnamed protein product [Gordionus sp. m RMFG-2023]
MSTKLSKIGKIVTKLHRSDKILNEFRLTTRKNVTIPLPCPTRWNSTFLILQQANEEIDALCNIARLYIDDCDMDAEDVKILKQIDSFLFYLLTKEVSSEKMPTIGISMVYLDSKLEYLLHYEALNTPLPSCILEAIKSMNEKCNKYIKKFDNLPMYICTILDPRIKIEALPSFLKYEDYHDRFRQHYEAFYPQINQVNGESLEKDRPICFTETVLQSRRTTSAIEHTSDEIALYLSEPPLKGYAIILDYWKINSGRFPRLSSMANDYLSAQASSVPSERVFSRACDTATKKRNRLAPNTLRWCLCLNAWEKIVTVMWELGE